MKKTISKLMLVLLLIPVLTANIPSFASNDISSNNIYMYDFPEKAVI